MQKVQEKGRNMTQSYKKPLQPQKNTKSNVTIQKSHQKFGYTTIADQLNTVSWGSFE